MGWLYQHDLTGPQGTKGDTGPIGPTGPRQWTEYGMGDRDFSDSDWNTIASDISGDDAAAWVASSDAGFVHFVMADIGTISAGGTNGVHIHFGTARYEARIMGADLQLKSSFGVCHAAYGINNTEAT